MTDPERSPYELEEAGEYGEAAMLWALSGFEQLLEAQFTLDGRARIGAGKLSRAISCDVRDGNERRAHKIYEILVPLLDEIVDTADDRILCGLALEWKGDAKTMLSEPFAIECYRSAEKHYAELSWQDSLWSDEPDFMQFYWAIEHFHDYYDGDLPSDVDALDFQERIDCKIAFAERFAE